MAALFGDDVPATDIGSFQFGISPTQVLEKVPDVPTTEPDLGVLGLLENKTFREISGIPQDNDLQLNLTVETLAFAESLGGVPNRGLEEQKDILLAGIPYTDSVVDVTNREEGTADNYTGPGIHFEPGVWMAVPAYDESDSSPGSGNHKATLCRMASIPHGATINAQGLQPSLTPTAGRPSFDPIDIIPFVIKSNTKIRNFNNLKFDFVPVKDGDGNIQGNNRDPQNLEPFNRQGTITEDVFKNPNQALANAIKDQNIVNLIKFHVTTESTSDVAGGGTANIAFLGTPPVTANDKATNGTVEGPPSNAFVPSVEATFWIETVECKFSVECGKSTETVYKPAKEFGPTFKVPPTLGRSETSNFTVWYTQLQYSQTVLLNFKGLSWPHVSVATLGELTTFNLVLPPITLPSEPLPPRPVPQPQPQPQPIYKDDDRSKIGCWSNVFPLKNVAAHASLLPTGKILYWGRRKDPKSRDLESMSEHSTDTFLLDPESYKSVPTATQPKLTTGNDVNIFCSGHCFQPDGSLLVVGGHLRDGHGVNSACVYNPFQDTWTAKLRMNDGRWYPSALTLNDGSALAIAGSYFDETDDATPTNVIPQIWKNDAWVSMPAELSLQSFPRLHLDPHGRVFMSGPQQQSAFLDVNAYGGLGAWTIDGPFRDKAVRDYGPSVMYESSKIMYIGGGMPPTNVSEFIDLARDKPEWKAEAAQMAHPRRHHNGTVLPDGTVLVTGGTSGPGFNDVADAIHVPELYDAHADPPTWTPMAAEAVDRCYHSVALLLPDGRVFSAGGGEWAPVGNIPNDPEDSHTDAQIYSPPYLFKGPRPTIVNAPTKINYCEDFEVTVGNADKIAKVSLVRLGSVTHTVNMNQSLTFLDRFDQQATTVHIAAPSNPLVVPPGHYMLFLLNQQGVPSVAPIISINASGSGPLATAPAVPKKVHAQRTHRPKHAELTAQQLNDKIILEEDRPAVSVGLTSKCPYGLGSCWGAAFDSLHRINDIDAVRPVLDHTNSIAFVYLHQDVIPDIDIWRTEFETVANQAYHLRGIELSLSGEVFKANHATEELLILAATKLRPEVILAPFRPGSKLEWDRVKQAPRPASTEEMAAYGDLAASLTQFGQRVSVRVTGHLHKHEGDQYSLDVREFRPIDASGKPVTVDVNGAPSGT